MGNIFFPPSITAMKFSILSLYRSIFFTPKFRRLSMILDTLCLVWFIATTFALIFSCTPVQATWHLELRGTANCEPYSSQVFWPELTDVMLDVAIVSFPVHMIRRLNMPFQKKVLVSCVFVMGGL